MKKFKLFLATFFIFFILAAGLLFNFFSNIISKPLKNSFGIEVKSGDTLYSLLDKLDTAGVLKSKLITQTYIKLKSINAKITPGKIYLSNDLSTDSLIEKLSTGKDLKESSEFRIIEGKTIEQIFSQDLSKFKNLDIKKAKEKSRNILLANLSDENKTKLSKIFPGTNSLEGLLYPDTYYIFLDATEDDIINTVLDNFFKKTEEISAASFPTKNLITFYDAIKLASIIEKEASANDDRSLISSVFHNRLSEDYLLQSDATVNYITGKSDPGVTLSDTKIDSPFNTYKYIGLPPTPISNPSIKSIQSAISPSESLFFYFFHTPDGKTYFNQYLYLHNQEVCLYLGC